METIIEYCNSIEECKEHFGNDEEEFRHNTFFQRCCAFDVLQIGETVKSLSIGLKEDHPDVQWKRIAGFRDIIAHNYAGINIDELWATVDRRVPELKESCERILAEMRSKGS